MNRLACLISLFLLSAPVVVSAQATGDIRELKLRDWQPRSMLSTRATVVSRPASLSSMYITIWAEVRRF